MTLSELDGFMAGLIVTPDLIRPSEWMPAIWRGEDPVFENAVQAQRVLSLLMQHYNGVSDGLHSGDYRPVFFVDRDGSFLWEIWMEGFWDATRLRPGIWAYWPGSGDAAVDEALATLVRLAEIGRKAPGAATPRDGDDALVADAPERIVVALDRLHQIAKSQLSSAAAAIRTPKIGRNDPCPCGSGRKFEKCCLN